MKTQIGSNFYKIETRLFKLRFFRIYHSQHLVCENHEAYYKLRPITKGVFLRLCATIFKIFLAKMIIAPSCSAFDPS